MFGCGISQYRNGFPSLVVATMKYGGGGLMAWGCFSWHGVGLLVVLHGLITIVLYCNILDN